MQYFSRPEFNDTIIESERLSGGRTAVLTGW